MRQSFVLAFDTSSTNFSKISVYMDKWTHHVTSYVLLYDVISSKNDFCSFYKKKCNLTFLRTYTICQNIIVLSSTKAVD